jgi:hypothetical protein
MALRTFRTKPSFICVNLTVLPSSILGYFWRNVSGVLTTVTRQLN